MLHYTLTPKRTILMDARIGTDEPTFVVEVPETDEELAAIVGYNDDGAAKLTMVGLAQEAIALKQQAAISKFLAEGAVTEKDAAGKTVFAPDQIASEAELLEIMRKAPTEAYRLLVGERAVGGGRQSAAAKIEAARIADRAANVAVYRSMLTEAGDTARPIIMQMVRALGYTELL
jgi:hypothetical protein